MIANTLLGPLHTNDPGMTPNVAIEIVKDDCYRLRSLAKIWTPATMLDLGVNVGVASLFARRLWPKLAIVGVDCDASACEAARLNIPNATIIQATAGGRELLAGGAPDLLKCDCEGGEVQFFYDLYLAKRLPELKVIVGEWHFWPARAMLERALSEDFVTTFVDPLPGAGPWSYFYAARRDLRLDW